MRRIYSIVACDENNLIGNGNKIPWNIPEDQHFFKMRTLHQVVIMGKNTWNSLPRRPLKNRVNLVLSDSVFKDTNEDYIQFSSLDTAIWYSDKIFNKDIYIIGGEQLYKTSLHQVDCIIMSKIKGQYKGDKYFPKLDAKWIESDRIKRPLFDIYFYERVS